MSDELNPANEVDWIIDRLQGGKWEYVDIGSALHELDEWRELVGDVLRAARAFPGTRS